MKLSDFKRFRIFVLLFFLLVGFLAINPNFDTEGAVIRSVDQNSSAFDAGIQTPDLSKISPSDLEVIKSINGNPINSPEEYVNTIMSIDPGEVITIQTNYNEYSFVRDENKSIGISVADVPSSNLRKGLDLQGGTRVLLKPESKITDAERANLIDIMNNRLNTYGISDITIREANDLAGGEKFILVEIAGATREEVKRLIESQGKFEAKIGNETVFKGSDKDIVFVCKNDGTCSGIENCGQLEDGRYTCRFVFEIMLSEAAAKRQAEITKDLAVNTTPDGQKYLEKTLDLFIDDKLVSSLQIGEGLKGKAEERIVISGPGFGVDSQSAIDDSIKEMQHLQTIMITGSLPVKLETVKIDNISPTLGASFIRNAWMAGLLALAGVAVVLFIRYRNLKVVVPSVITMASEIFLVLAAAALFKFNLDLAAIAGIIAAVGTGVDDQIVITDEILSGTLSSSAADWKRRIKKAFFIVFVAYATTVAAMVPLFVAGAGLLTGFAFSTIVGVTIGVFVTRPAFASILESVLKPKE